MQYMFGKNLSLGYEGREIIRDVNFTIDHGDYLCIIGENGSGKTTLMKTLLGLVPPIHGEIVFHEKGSRNKIGYLPQQTMVQKDFPASVEEIVLSGCQGSMGFHPFYTRSDRERLQQNLERMQILDLRKKCYRTLSGGQQQRVLLARALCAAKSALLLDEPVSGLDPRAAYEMYELIHKLNQEGMTILMISHDIDCALRYASHILHINHTPYFGSKKEYQESAQGKAYIALRKAGE